MNLMNPWLNLSERVTIPSLYYGEEQSIGKLSGEAEPVLDKKTCFLIAFAVLGKFFFVTQI